MKIVKINTDHYVIVDDSEIKEGDWFYSPATKEVLYAFKDMLSWNNDTSQEHKGWKKITHSTHPMQGVFPIPITEVKELLGEVDYSGENLLWLAGYEKCLEDNKDKKYTRNEVHALMCRAFEQGLKKADILEAGLEGKETDVECAWILTRHDSTPKTEWEVEYDENGKLRLKPWKSTN